MIAVGIAAVTFTASVLMVARLWSLATESSLDGRLGRKWLYLMASVVCVIAGALATTLIARAAGAAGMPCNDEIIALTNLPSGTEVDSSGRECFEPARTLCDCFAAHYWSKVEQKDPKVREECLMSQAIACHGANIVRLFGK